MDTIDLTSQEYSLRRFSQLKKQLVSWLCLPHDIAGISDYWYYMAEEETPVKTVQGCLFILLYEE